MADILELDPQCDPAAVTQLLADMLTLLRSEMAFYLSTLDDEGYPDTRAILNLRYVKMYPGLVPLFAGHDHDMMLLFTTNASSTKFRQLEKDPRASIYVCRSNEFHGLRFLGEVEIVRDQAFREQVWQPGWEQYYPGGPRSEDYVVMRMVPRIAKYYHALRCRELRLPLPEAAK